MDIAHGYRLSRSGGRCERPCFCRCAGCRGGRRGYVGRPPGSSWRALAAGISVRSVAHPLRLLGVNSLPPGQDCIDRTGENAGFYERASGSDVCEYFAEAAERLTQTGRVRVLTQHEYLGGESDGEQVRDLMPDRLKLSRFAARSSMLDTWRRRFLPPTSPHLRCRHPRGSSPSTTCRRTRDPQRPMPCSGPGRRRWPRAAASESSQSSFLALAGGPASA